MKKKIPWTEYSDWAISFDQNETNAYLRYGQAFYNHFWLAGYKLKNPHPELFYVTRRHKAIEIIMKEYVEMLNV